jgi:hypothetical protein
LPAIAAPAADEPARATQARRETSYVESLP